MGYAEQTILSCITNTARKEGGGRAGGGSCSVVARFCNFHKPQVQSPAPKRREETRRGLRGRRACMSSMSIRVPSSCSHIRARGNCESVTPALGGQRQVSHGVKQRATGRKSSHTCTHTYIYIHTYRHTYITHICTNTNIPT